MKKQAIIGIIIAVVIIAIGIYFFSNQGYKVKVNSPIEIKQETTIKLITTLPPAPPKNVTVDIDSEARFVPAIIEINKGDTVEWYNGDRTTHRIMSDSGQEITSVYIGDFGTWSHLFKTPGTYPYHCDLHKVDEEKGTVIVK